MIPRVAVAGLGGFAGDHHRALGTLEAEGRCRVVATCDPDVTLRAGVRQGLEAFAGLDELLSVHAGKLEMLTLPLPIPLHASAHAAAVQAGVPCYLEKPPSLWWPEFQSMVEEEQRAFKDTQVGFNFVGDPFRRDLKRRILEGEFGALKAVSLTATWPRDSAYYARNDWAGRLRVRDQWVVDSCIGNALAHYVQNLLFWAGTGSENPIAEVETVRAWLGRTRPIESFDTAFVEAELLSDVRLRIAATHAEGLATFEEEALVFEGAEIRFERWNEAKIQYSDGRSETVVSGIPDHAALLRHNFCAYLDFLAGKAERPTTTLEDSRSFVLICNLALISSGAIHDVSSPPALARFVEEGHGPGGVPQSAIEADLGRLKEVAETL